MNLTQVGRAMRQWGIELIPAYSPAARGRRERMFRPHQERLPTEWVGAGITDRAAANPYLQDIYRPAFNSEFMQPAREEGSAFVPYSGVGVADILGEQHERVVGKDHGVAFEGLKLPIPQDRARYHSVKVKGRVPRYPRGQLAVFHGPRCLAHYDANGTLEKQKIEAAA